MDLELLRNRLRGFSVTTATPFTKDLSSIDENGLTRNLKYLADAGVDFVVPCGNTGEFYSLTDQEWRDVVDLTLNSMGEKSVVMPGIGHSLGTAIEQLRYAENAGAEMAMVMYPQHVFKSEEGMLQYCHRILEASKDIGVVLYKKGPLLSDEVLSKLANHPGFVGVKYAFGRIVDFARTVQKIGTHIAWSCGTAERFAPFFWLAGARGFTSGLGNFAPNVSLSLFNALSSGDYETAMQIQAKISPLEYLREKRDASHNVPVIKSALDHIGLSGGNCRPPIHVLTDEEHKEIHAAIAKMQ